MGLTLQQAMAQGFTAAPTSPALSALQAFGQPKPTLNIPSTAPAAPATPSYPQSVASGFNKAGQDLQSSVDKGPLQQFGAGFQAVGDVLKPALVDPVNKALSPISGALQKLNPIVDFLSGKSQGTTTANQQQAQEQAAASYDVWSKAHPEAAKNLEALSNISQAGGIIAGGIEAAKAAPEVLTKLSNTAENALPDITASTPKASSVSPLDAAQTERSLAAGQGVKALTDINKKVGGFENGLGPAFQNATKQIEAADPNLTLNLSNEQIAKLNSLKEGKNFALPDRIQQAADSQANLPQSKFGSIKLTPEAQAELAKAQGDTQVSLKPSEAQDLIRRLNQSTYKEVGGSLQVDQQRVALTNEIKNAAQAAFGHITDSGGNSIWDSAYQNYAQGKSAVDKLGSIVNLDNSASPADINKSLNEVLKLGKTPEGKIILQNALDEFRQTSGIDLTDPTKAIHQILDKQMALEAAQSEAGKPGFIKQVLDPKYLAKRAVGGTVTVGILYPILRAIQKSASGK